MKSKLLLIAACFLIAAGAKAQKGIDNGTPFGTGEDSVRCRTNISLFTPYAKSNNFKDAYPFWKAVYDECPGSTKNIYIYGVQIINWQIAQETDATKRDALIDELIKLYDNRAKYFGDDERYGKDWIVAQKAQMVNQLKAEATDQSVIYKWLDEVIDEYKEKVDPLAISLFMFSSFKLMQGDMDKYKSQYVEDFLKCSALLDAQLVTLKTANNEKEIESNIARKTDIEQNFAASGAADCETLESIYTSKIEENKNDLEFLKETMILLRRVGCYETDLFITASEHAYKIEPTAESAQGLGTKAFKEKDYATSEKYFNEAIDMTDDPEVKANLYYLLSVMASQQGQYVKAKQNSLKCIGEKADYARAYITIAGLYANGAKGIFPDDPVLQKCVFFAVIDKLEKARQVATDPTIASEAAKQIAQYRNYLPSKEEVFMHPEIESGGTLLVGGWINETVRIR